MISCGAIVIMTETISPQIIYPETDGQPMTESDATRDYLLYCVAVLENYFKSRRGVYVSGNLFIYYQEGSPKQVISPDVFVVFGVNQRKRKSYKTWEEGGQLPQFILEITSHSTRKQDEVTKPELYARLGVSEYFQYDPTGDYLTPQLKGQRLINGVYQPLEMGRNWLELDCIYSQNLGLDLCLEPRAESNTSASLRLYDPATRTKLLSYEELAQAKQDAEQEILLERQQTEAEQKRAEAEQKRAEAEQKRAEAEHQRAERLAERLRSLGIEPETEDLI
jgi:Uma2 family endonuclease